MDAAREVATAAHERATALVAGDAARLRDLLHEEFRWTTHRGEILDRSEYVSRNTEGHAAWRSQTLSDVQVVVVGETAVLYAEAADVVALDEHGPQTFRMPMTQVWACPEGRWVCLAGHAGPRRP